MSSNLANPLRTFHYCITAYVALLCIAAASGAGIIKALANAAAIGIFAIGLVNWLFYPAKSKLTKLQNLGLTFFYIGLSFSMITNSSQNEFVDILKIALSPLFLFMGTALSNEEEKWSVARPNAKLLFALLVILPLLAWAAQLVLGTTSLATNTQVGIFANRNNAGLYAIALLAFYCAIGTNVITHPGVYLMVGVMFGTLGLLAAVVSALLLCHGNIRHFVSGCILGIIFIVVSQYFPELSALVRLKPVVDSVVLLASGRIDLATVTYGELVQLLQTTDLSFIFRLKHWNNLLSLFLAGGWSEWFFGFGSGASIRLANMQLVPHNDYIRVGFEFGAITLLGFIILLFSTVFSIGRGWRLVPTLTVCIYFFSENLINNYVAMALFFFSAGIMSQRANVQKTGMTK